MPKQDYPDKQIVEQILSSLARLRRNGNHDGVRHLVAFAAEAVAPSGNAAQRRKGRRATVRAARRAVVA